MLRSGRLVISALLGASLIAVSIAACGEAEEPGPAEGAAAKEDEVLEETEEPENGLEEPDDPAVEQSVEACLVGTWLADNANFGTFLEGEASVFDSVEGSVLITFNGDGTSSTAYDDWLVTTSAEGETLTIHRDGIDVGEYTVDDGLLSVWDTEVGSTMTLLGVAGQAAGLNMVIDPEPLDIRQAPFECLGNQATVSAPEGDLILNRQ